MDDFLDQIPEYVPYDPKEDDAHSARELRRVRYEESKEFVELADSLMQTLMEIQQLPEIETEFGD